MRQPAIVREYHELLQAIDTRRRELGMPMIELDERAGLPLGYVGKLLTDPTKRNAKTLGRTSLGLVLKALGIQIVVMHAAGVHPSQAKAQQGETAGTVEDRMRNLARQGAITLNKRFTPEQMSRRMRRAARLRWAKVREEKRLAKLRAIRRAEQEAKEQRRAERLAREAAEAAMAAQAPQEATTQPFLTDAMIAADDARRTAFEASPVTLGIEAFDAASACLESGQATTNESGNGQISKSCQPPEPVANHSQRKRQAPANPR